MGILAGVPFGPIYKAILWKQVEHDGRNKVVELNILEKEDIVYIERQVMRGYAGPLVVTDGFACTVPEEFRVLGKWF